MARPQGLAWAYKSKHEGFIGGPLVAGRTVTGASAAEAKLTHTAELVPFDLGARIQELGGHYKSSMLPFSAHIEVDGTLITGQNAASATMLAYKLIEFLTEQERAQGKRETLVDKLLKPLKRNR